MNLEQLKKFFKSFFYAGRGILSTIKTEKNMRVHLVMMVYMFSILLFTDWFQISKSGWCALLLSCALVVSGELVNTAIENTVDMTAKEYNDFAKRAKDAASGAVLVSAIFSVCIGLVVLLQREAFAKMFDYFKHNPLMLLLLLLSLIPAFLFVFCFGKPRSEQESQTNEKNV